MVVQTDGKVLFNGDRARPHHGPGAGGRHHDHHHPGTGKKAKATGVTITFNTAVNPTLANNIKIYLFAPRRGGKPSRSRRISLTPPARP